MTLGLTSYLLADSATYLQGINCVPRYSTGYQAQGYSILRAIQHLFPLLTLRPTSCHCNSPDLTPHTNPSVGVVSTTEVIVRIPHLDLTKVYCFFEPPYKGTIPVSSCFDWFELSLIILCCPKNMPSISVTSKHRVTLPCLDVHFICKQCP